MTAFCRFVAYFNSILRHVRAGQPVCALFVLAVAAAVATSATSATSAGLAVAAQDDATQTRESERSGERITLLGILDQSAKDALTARPDEYIISIPLSEQALHDSAAFLKSRFVSKPDTRHYLVFLLGGLAPQQLLLLRDAEDGQWNAVTPLEATLLAEDGMTEERFESYRRTIARFDEQLAARTSGITDPVTLTRLVFEFLHGSVLTGGYDLNRTNLSVTLDSGVFNCVSATILFNYFASRRGLKTTGLETTGHAKSRVVYDHDYLDIETTCTQWQYLPDRVTPLTNRYTTARPITRGQSGQTDSISTARDGMTESFVPSSVMPQVADAASSLPENTASGRPGQLASVQRRRMRQIDFVQLTATVYYNQGVDFSQNGLYERALASYAKAIHLDPNNKTIMGNLKATLNNWAILLASEHYRFPDSIRIAECGLALDPEFEQYRTNLPIFYQHWISELKKASRKDEADYLEKEFHKRFP